MKIPQQFITTKRVTGSLKILEFERGGETGVRIVFSCLAVFAIGLGVGAYYLWDSIVVLVLALLLGAAIALVWGNRLRVTFDEDERKVSLSAKTWFSENHETFTLDEIRLVLHTKTMLEDDSQDELVEGDHPVLVLYAETYRVVLAEEEEASLVAERIREKLAVETSTTDEPFEPQTV